MVSLSRSEAVVELGKRLVAQLDDETDLAATWLAHLVAERMAAVEAAAPADKPAAEEACAKIIMDLWRARAANPQRRRPLGELEPLLRTLASLDVESSDYRYYASALRTPEQEDLTEEAQLWFRVARGVDYTARLLIQFALRNAAEEAASEAAAWVELAEAAGAEDVLERLVVRFIIDPADALAEPEAPFVTALKERLARLEGFTQMAETLAADIRSQIVAAES